MNPTFRLPAFRAVLSLFVFCALAVAQTPPDSPKPAPPADLQTTPPKVIQPGQPIPAALPRRGPQPGYGHKAAVDRRLAALSRLQSLMMENLKLSPDQQKKIEAMFDDYMGGLINSKFRPHLQPQPGEVAAPQDLPKLKQKLAEAQKEGQDKGAIASIQASINAAKIALEPSIVDEPVFFVLYLEKELSDEQRVQFGKIVKRWQMLRPTEVAPDDDFKQVRRSTRDPKLRDSEELGKKLDEIIVTAIRTVPLGPQRLDLDVMKELAVATKPKVLEVLTPPQREHFEKTLAMLKRWAEEDPKLSKKARERLKDHRPTVAPDQEAQAPASGAGTQP